MGPFLLFLTPHSDARASDVASVNLDSDEYVDINVVASTLKLYFRELPDPLFTYGLYNEFMDAARTANPLQPTMAARSHTLISQGPRTTDSATSDFTSKSTSSRTPTMRPSNSLCPIYTSERAEPTTSLLWAILTQYPICRVLALEKINQMSASNLSIVFGPTLFRQPPEGGGGEGLGLADLMSLQCRSVVVVVVVLCPLSSFLTPLLLQSRRNHLASGSSYTLLIELAPFTDVSSFSFPTVRGNLRLVSLSCSSLSYILLIISSSLSLSSLRVLPLAFVSL